MNYDKLILGEGYTYTTNSNETGLNNNILVVGGSGSGKTMSVLEARLIETYNDSLIVSLSKNKLVPKYTRLFEDRGYTVKHISFVNPLASTDFYNPLSYLRTYGDIKHLAESIVGMQEKSSNSSADPYWDMIATSLLSAEIGYCLATIRSPSFVDVLELHDSLQIYEKDYMISTSLDDKFELLPEDHFAVKCWRSFRELPIRTAGSAFSSLNVLLDTLFTPELRKTMRNRNSIDITEIGQKKSVLFITTSPVSKSMHGLANLFISQAIKELFEHAEEQPTSALPVSVQFLIDDFACSKIARFDEYISIFREKNISAMLLLQSESQLAGMYGEKCATTIINNCDSYVFAGGQDLMSAHHISKRANVPLEDILYMPIGSEWIFRRGLKPIKTERYRITENQIYKKVTQDYESHLLSTPKEKVSRQRSKTNFFLSSKYKDINDVNDLTQEVEALNKKLEKKFDELFGNLAS